MNDTPQDVVTEARDVVQEAIELQRLADEKRQAAIKELLDNFEKIVRGLNALSYDWQTNVLTNGQIPAAPATPPRPIPVPPQPPPAPPAAKKGARRFEGMDIVEIAVTLLEENGNQPIYGHDIERLSKAGGYGRTDSGMTFQKYMNGRFKNSGRLENIGGNTWRLRI